MKGQVTGAPPSSTGMHCGRVLYMVVQGIVQVEGLVLKHVEPGLYDLHCLPINIVGSDGAPARCILIA